MLKHCLASNAWLLQASLVFLPGVFAQASKSRPSKSTRSAPWDLRELSLKRQAPVLSESPSRSSEEVSPKGENVKVPLFHCSSSRLGERSSLDRGLLA